MSGPRRCGSWRPAAVVGDNGNGYVETDPTGRYGRLDELLGKGAMKSVYRGFDEERGVEVAWNKASLSEVLRSPDDGWVQRVYSEVQLLKRLRHDAIIGFQASWVDVPRRSFNFITELFSSGTLRSYRLRYPRVSLRAVKSWARQILAGLAYLHGHHPPVIHRDLKCDNIFVNGNQGQVKIGDLGLAAVLRDHQTAHSVIGTPEFMAPEMYDEDYDHRVDVWSFGMCVLEMLTLDYPYSECSNPAQIYKKVTAGKLPDAFLYRLKDDDARRFIGRCLVPASKRPSAADLLLDPFLLDLDDQVAEAEDAAQAPPATCNKENMTITGKLNADEDTIFLKVQITVDDTEHNNNVRNIYFPFDLVSDMAAEVAEEMVKELEITDRDPSEIAAMIEQEIQRLLPNGEQQHEYSHDDDDQTEEHPPPFYYLSSSPASSQSSLCASSGGFSAGPHVGAWAKDHGYYAACLSDDDDSMSSMHSDSGGKYSALHYDTSSGHGREEAQLPGDVLGGQAANTRFGPARGGQSSRSPHAGRRDEEDNTRRRRRRMPRNRSMVDMRSQLLHRTLVEELNRRLFFNTVGAVENIGFRDPTASSPVSPRGTRTGRHDKHHQYVML